MVIHFLSFYYNKYEKHQNNFADSHHNIYLIFKY